MAPSKKMAQRKSGVSQEARISALVRRAFDKRVEKKVSSSTAVGTSIVTTGTVHAISVNIVEGDDVFNRSGTVIRLARVRALFRGTAVTTSSSVRFILFRDMLNQGTTPSASELLPASTWISQYSDVRMMQQQRFHILKDVTMDLNIAGQNVVTKQYDLPLDGKVFFNGVTNAAASNGKGALFLLVIGNAISSAYDYTIQMVFTDA
jgi:hypothetical protein